MNRSELADRIVQRELSQTKADTELCVKIILNAMADAIANGDRIEIRNFGSFTLHYREPYAGRNPRTGEKVDVPGKYFPHFKGGKYLRYSVDL